MQSFTPLKRITLATLIALGSIAAVQAEEAEKEYTFMDSVMQGKAMTSFRLRYEHVEQDGNGPGAFAAIPLQNAEALTLRSLIGWQTSPFHNFSFAAQAIGVTKFKDDYNDGTNTTLTNGVSNQPETSGYAKVVDPDIFDINQLYVDWTGIKNNKVRLGRQAVNLDNVRFIGDIGFRQVMQVFDGVSLVSKSIPDTEIYVAHMESVRQITTKLRTDGHLDILNAKYRFTPTESLTAYGYLSTFKDLGLGRAWFGNAAGAGGGALNGNANQLADQGNKTFGLRLDGIHPFNPNFRAVYTAEYAKQTDFAGGDSRIDAHYYKIGGGVGIDNFTIRADQELLSSNNGTYGFQTPFGTNHLFQGWVDKFLATPRDGIEDSFVTATYRYSDFLFFADYHIIKADRDFAKVGGGTGDEYGTEWNVAATYNYDKNILAKLEYGKFKESDQYNAGRIRDTEKLWLTAAYTF